MLKNVLSVARIMRTDLVVSPVPDVIQQSPKDICFSFHEMSMSPEIPWTESRVRAEVIKDSIEIVQNLCDVLWISIYSLESVMPSTQSVG